MSRDQFEAFVRHAYWGLDKLFESLAELSEEEFHAAPLAGVRSAHDTLVHTLGFQTFWGPVLRGVSPAGEGASAGPQDLATLRERWGRCGRGGWTTCGR